MPPPSGIIIYPEADWNSFASQQFIDDWIDLLTPDPEWSNLSPDQKEAYTLQGAWYIKMCPNLVLPDDTTDDLELAQAITAYYAYKRGEFIHDPNHKSITSESVGDVSVSYDAKYRAEVVDIPPNAYALLAQYGCTAPSTGFSQSTVAKV